MHLYRTGADGLAPVTALEPGETTGLADALLAGDGGAVGGDDLLFVERRDTEDTAAALTLDHDGSLVVVEVTDGAVESDLVTAGLRDASEAAALDYADLDVRFADDGDEPSLREAHAAFFDRDDPLAEDAFNSDQQVRLLGPAVADEAVEVATFLGERDLTIDCVRVVAFDGGDGEFLVRFESPASPVDDAAGKETDAEGATDEAPAGEVTRPERNGGGAVGDADTPEAGDAERRDGPAGDAATDTDDEDTTDGQSEPESDEGSAEREMPEVLDAMRQAVCERLAGTFDGRVEDLASIERGSELLVRPDHPSYAGGVLRYRIVPDEDGEVDFEVNIYGGSEAEKEQMREVLRSNRDDIDEELGYDVVDGYDGLLGTRDVGEYDEGGIADVAEEFDRLVGFLHPRVMRAWRDAVEA